VRKAIANVRLVAIGGITHENAASVIEAGADTVAVISALLVGGSTTISDRYRSLAGILLS
jgi:thiamine-phosphate pyrophosphorylase